MEVNYYYTFMYPYFLLTVWFLSTTMLFLDPVFHCLSLTLLCKNFGVLRHQYWGYNSCLHLEIRNSMHKFPWWFLETPQTGFFKNSQQWPVTTKRGVPKYHHCSFKTPRVGHNHQISWKNHANGVISTHKVGFSHVQLTKNNETKNERKMGNSRDIPEKITHLSNRLCMHNTNMLQPQNFVGHMKLRLNATQLQPIVTYTQLILC